MDEKKNDIVEQSDIEAVEPEKVIADIMSEGDPDVMLAQLEKKAALAPRFRQAQDTILASQTYPRDWHVFGKGDDATVCLSSAGAERIGRLFDIKFFEVEHKKEDFVDANGEAYRYIYQGKAALGNRVVFATGIFSTRDKFLGYANKEWKAKEDINENAIQMAAYHVFCGNGIKALLGLRGIPVAEYNRIMKRTGQEPKKTGSHDYGSGTKGGTIQSDVDMQIELGEACIAIANAGYVVVRNSEGKCTIEQQDNNLKGLNNVEIAKLICEEISSFKGKDGTMVKGLLASALKGKRLTITLGTAQVMKEQAERGAE